MCLLQTGVGEPTKCKVYFADVISLPEEASLLEQKSMSAEWVVIRTYWSWKEVVFFLLTQGLLFFPLRTESHPKAQ